MKADRQRRLASDGVIAGLTLAALALAGCGDSTGHDKPDAGSLGDASVADKAGEPVADAGPPEAAPNECDPVKQDCPGAGVCAPRCSSAMLRFACADEMRGAGSQGSACTANSDCKKGTACLAPAKHPKACYTWCDKSAPMCPSGTMCLETPMSIACGGVQTISSALCYPP